MNEIRPRFRGIVVAIYLLPSIASGLFFLNIRNHYSKLEGGGLSSQMDRQAIYLVQRMGFACWVCCVVCGGEIGDLLANRADKISVLDRVD